MICAPVLGSVAPCGVICARCRDALAVLPALVPQGQPISILGLVRRVQGMNDAACKA